MNPLEVGDFAVRRLLVDADVMSRFARLVGDENPIHSDPEAARSAGFKAPIAYGMVAGAMFSEILGNRLPGPGAVYASQSFRFVAPVYVGDEIELKVEVVKVREDQRVVTVRTTCTTTDGRLCVDGEAVLVRRTIEASDE